MVKILLVEDKTATLEITKTYLTEEGFDVIGFKASYDALRYLGENPLDKFDIIILDKVMPGIDGINMTKLLRFDLRYNNTPIIMVTSVDNEESKKEARMAGVDNYIIKPVGRDYLIQKINECLKNNLP